MHRQTTFSSLTHITLSGNTYTSSNFFVELNCISTCMVICLITQLFSQTKPAIQISPPTNKSKLERILYSAINGCHQQQHSKWHAKLASLSVQHNKKGTTSFKCITINKFACTFIYRMLYLHHFWFLRRWGWFSCWSKTDN